MSEHDHQKAVFDVIRLNETRHPQLRWIFAVPNGGSRHPAVAGKLKAEGVRKGILDIAIPIPRSGYHGAFIEMKHGKNKLTPEQKEFAEFLKDGGYFVGVAYDATAALNMIEEYCGVRLAR